MSNQSEGPWAPVYGVRNGGVRPMSTVSSRVAGLIARAARSAASHFDSWQNPVTGFGTTRDKTTYGLILPSRLLTDEELSALYHHDDMAARMVDVVPQEMMREPFDVEVGNVGLDEAIADMVEGLAVREKFAAGIRWARAYGGGACLIGADDGRDASLELKPERAKGIDYLYDIDKRYLWPVSYYDEVGHPKLGQPRTYLVTTHGGYSSNTSEVHESRLIVFHGAPTAHRERILNRGWNLSVMQRAFEILRQFNTGWQAVENMMTDGSQSVFKMDGLTELQSAEGGEAAIRQRVRDIDMFRSTVRAVVLDAASNESFERLGTSFEQIPNVLDKFMLRLAASVEIPVTILMGQSPAGMSATGESDLRWFYDRIRAQQTTMLSPRVRRLISVWLQTKTGQAAITTLAKGEVPRAINIKFPPLWTETPLAVADRELKVAQTDQIYLTTQVFTPEEVALKRGRADGFAGQVQLSDEQIEMREAMVSVQFAGGADAPEAEPTEPADEPDVTERTDAGPRTFELHRDEDETGVSGTGVVAEGCVFADGKTALRWKTATASTTFFDSIEDALKVHGHSGKTRIVWTDERTA